MAATKSTVLVTGGAGYIGSHTAKALRQAGHDVVIVDIEGPGYEGVLYTRREWKVIGGFSGQQFDAVIDTEVDEGEVRLRFLVSEQTLRQGKTQASLN